MGIQTWKSASHAREAIYETSEPEPRMCLLSTSQGDNAMTLNAEETLRIKLLTLVRRSHNQRY